MTTINEKIRNVEGLIDPANGDRSFETVTLDATGGALDAGNVLGMLTATGVYVAYNEAGGDGSETVAGILLYSVEAVSGEVAVLVRDATFKTTNLIYTGTAATVTDGLAAVGIIARA